MEVGRDELGANLPSIGVEDEEEEEAEEEEEEEGSKERKVGQALLSSQEQRLGSGRKVTLRTIRGP